MGIKLNCDMGESFGIWKMGLDEEIMPYIDMANLACGFHASDALTMNKSVLLAKKNNVTIGAHPGYQDLVGFGRRSMSCSDEEISSLVLYQMGALSAFCKAHETCVSYVKPHGGLYHDMMNKENVFKSILSAISSYDKSIKLMILSLRLLLLRFLLKKQSALKAVQANLTRLKQVRLPAHSLKKLQT